jgi:hypothetical protein
MTTAIPSLRAALGRARVVRKLAVAALVLCLAAPAMTLPTSAQAEPPRPGPAASRDDAPAGARVRVEVLSVYATNSGQVDPRLRDLQKQLPPMFTGFQLLSTHTDQVALNQSTSFPLEGGRRMKITLLDRGEQNARARIEVFKDDEKKVDTTVTVPRGKAIIFSGFPYQDGKLVFPVSVTY